ncbi:MAG: PAS domain S-box protein [Bacteroidota bacterium]
MTPGFLRTLTTVPPIVVRLIGTLAIVVVAIADFVTGSEMSFVLFYVLPVAYVSWYDGRPFGLALAILCSLIHIVEVLMVSPALGLPIHLWNGAAKFGVLVSVAVGLDYIHAAYKLSLHAAENKYTRIVEAAIEGIVATDNDWRITFVNQRAASLFGQSTDALRGRILLDFAHDPQAHVAFHSRTKMLTTQEMSGPVEVEFRRPDGQAFWALATLTPTKALNGTHEGLVILLTDITELKRSEEELNRRHREISAMQRLSSGLSQSLDLAARLENAVDTVLDVTGFEAGCIYLMNEKGTELTLHFHRGIFSPEFISRVQQWPVGKGITGHVAATGIPTFIEDAIHNPVVDRRLLSLESLRSVASIPLTSKERVLGVLNIFKREPFLFSPGEQLMLQTLGKQIGISLENSHLYEMAREREQQIRQLSVDLVQVQEEERRRFARELHDGLSQLLTTLKINTELALKNVGEDTVATERHLREVIALANEAQMEAKQIAYDLRPAVLDDFGLKAAISLHATNFERRTQTGVDLHMPEADVRFDSLIETTIYRIVQELLTNVAKHSGASRVTIQMLVRGHVLALTVADNGRGFEVDQGFAPQTDQPRYGLRNVRERVEFFGGVFRVESVLGHGTEFMIELPLREKALKPQMKETVS